MVQDQATMSAVLSGEHVYSEKFSRRRRRYVSCLTCLHSLKQLKLLLFRILIINENSRLVIGCYEGNFDAHCGNEVSFLSNILRINMYHFSVPYSDLKKEFTAEYIAEQSLSISLTEETAAITEFMRKLGALISDKE